MALKDFILKYAPIVVQNVGISLYNTFLYSQRHKGRYKAYRDYYRRFETAAAPDVACEADRRLHEFLRAATQQSRWYGNHQGKSLHEFPILEKTQLLANMDSIRTMEEKDGIVSLTGGTTGASMKVIYAPHDMQERFALKDHFRARYGYSLGKKVAWFSGKSLVRPKDLLRGDVYRDDYINKIRFFSTFHISQQNFDAYWQAFCQFKPEYLVGFPSSVYDLCTMAEERNLKYDGSVTAFFPTAETVLPKYRETISRVLGCQVIDQYAASEGAPFILQCPSGSLHIHPLTGVFEVVDENLQAAEEGEILVTAFTTTGTPLIRYRIGDRIKLAPPSFKCACGSSFPVVEYIDGRTSDFIWSPENGKVNLGNISNCTKDVAGIVCFQVTQSEADSVSISVVANDQFTADQQQHFLDAMTLRLGKSVAVHLHLVQEIPREKSGKFRIVKNMLTPESMSPAALQRN
ncbi:phenylacetate--CoA ligase family protein [Candidimonas sp. SYP-B2681]|uniref:phenylacetate--CoA ligase family protein n=1 Tax=Candidimonas sp. SYP-B2681 TaxID=2497686 RepID=UPI000F866797|nr:phenylacetate--CoA ligase family protein [Candidimonas sp. SYP-B2681]RTZ42333.1 phenylacetate--CoA ligase family protein [Candidimonas sp. SYP-B2681]